MFQEHDEILYEKPNHTFVPAIVHLPDDDTTSIRLITYDDQLTPPISVATNTLHFRTIEQMRQAGILHEHPLAWWTLDNECFQTYPDDPFAQLSGALGPFASRPSHSMPITADETAGVQTHVNLTESLTKPTVSAS